ncbi:type II toxin-antitoxin system RelE/ParE family toxin [Paraeggerthella hongkongensis]|uniref:Type II toxin-antitoxin system RelE/ParE family toxin n=1 Tax=Paraeggerthella hongkongensis TaxID=230658 RepID=A0A3N0BLG8_9ACTN|nr:type II toxin-antitoxin system RelE/ParE family toxin [Paraeggerthella hongkongensis]RNL48923.1 type II toxin-antitoxin system RelE/ParE family toxin [Paraeggerthella hongkongensis]
MNTDFSICVTDAFDDDLRDVLSYLMVDCGSPNAAERMVRAVDRAKELLTCSPFMNAVSSRPRWLGRSYREHYVLKYVIVYRIDGEVVWFLRLFHQTQLYERFVTEWAGSK